MGQALYRKYRPKKLDEIIGQEHITKTLSNAIANNSISHAYLLTGPRGVGKTSIARILAHQINDIEYNEDSNHLDIIEIDAASNRRIDEIRELRDKVNILPSLVKYKVYIIDEVHMLTREAFNALLKTLEEPPAHVVFILATTEAHKLPDTIISRTQHFTFKPIDKSDLFNHLKTIAKAEKIIISDDALNLISEHGDGSFRDSIGLLDQVRGSNKDISIDDIHNLLGIAPKTAITKLLESLNSNSPKDIIEILNKLHECGIQSGILSKQLSEELRTNIIENNNYQNNGYLKLLSDLVNVPASIKPDRQLEIVLLDFVFNNAPTKINQEEEIKPKKTVKEDHSQEVNKPTEIIKEVKTPELIEPTMKIEEELSPKKPEPTESLKAKKENINEEDINLDESSWPLIVSAVKQKNNTLYGILRMAKVRFEENNIILIFKFPFHKKKIDDQKNKSIITELIKEKTGKNFDVKSEIEKNETKVPKENKKNNSISSVSNIFEGAEVLES